MSEKATGFDWKSKGAYTLRHAAGSPKYTTVSASELQKLQKAPL